MLFRLLTLLAYLTTSKSARTDLSLLQSVRSGSSPANQKAAVEGLIYRHLPTRSADFVVEIDPSLGERDRDTFQLESLQDGRLKITGSSGVAASLGLGVYLKEYGHCQIAWSDWQLNLASPLPVVSAVVQRSTNDRFHYNSNVCTFGYTYVWWDWTRWQKEIDWMALNGVNFPLAFVGQESITQKVFKQLRVKDSELFDWFTGPAFLTWFRMGNLIKWGGPLSQTFIDDQAQLQHKILSSMRQFGMLPVLPAFSGHVPEAIKKLYPEAAITKLSPWSHFNATYTGTYYLNPTDPLYAKIGNLFIQEYVQEFGTDHFYNIDPWNEMTPAESSVEYLAQASFGIMSSLRTSDPKAIWVLQAWMFYFDTAFWTKPRAKAFLTGVPKGEMIVLDLAAEYSPMYSQLDSFFGQPFIFCMIQNYGGRMGLYGHITNINMNVFKARSSANSTMIGTGLTMESTGTNYIVYELMNEMHYRTQPVNINKWIGEYTHRRYGFKDGNLQKAWSNLVFTAYNNSALGHEIVIERPTWKMRNKAFPGYNTSSLVDSIRCVNKALESVATQTRSPLLRHDVANMWREMLFVIMSDMFRSLNLCVKNRDVEGFRAKINPFLSALDDLDRLMMSHHSYLLGTWVSSAEKLARSDKDRELFRFNALNQLTLWGPSGEISDYAGKQWADLIKGYYKERWHLFLTYNERALSKSMKFNQTAFEEDLFKVIERPFGMTTRNFTTQPQGDTFQIAKQLYQTYKHWLEATRHTSTG